MKVLSCLILFALQVPVHLWAASPYSNAEGVLAKGHDHSLDIYRRRYFYDSDGSLNPRKMDELIEFLQFQKGLLLDSAKLNRKTNLIWMHGYDNEEAEKEGLEAQGPKSEAIAPFDFAIGHTRELQASYARMTPGEIHEKVETILLFFAAAYTPYPMNYFTKAKEETKKALENFIEWRIDDRDQLQASNLLLNGRFASQEDLVKARKQGLDLSKLNPPSSPIWTDNEVESYDPYNEVYFGERLFPPREDPLPEFYYERMGNGQVKIKTHWFDPQELSKEGRPKKKDVTFRVAWESYTTSVTGHLARIIGYPALPTTFRQKVKLHLGNTRFEDFMRQWKSVHSTHQGSAVTFVERIPGENAILLKGVTLEAYPSKKKYRRMGPFRMGDNGLRNRREYRAMPLYNGLISLEDLLMIQSRVDAYKDPVKGWQPLFMMADTGSALSIPTLHENRGTVNEFTPRFTHRDLGHVRLFWISWFDTRAWKDTTYSDVKWLARRMARIKTTQIDAIMATSGFPPPVQALYAEKLKSRINHLILDFELQKEGFSLHPVLSGEELARRYPKYINSKGLLKEKAQEYPGNVQPILGESFTPYQRLVVWAINGFQNKFLSLFNPASYGPGKVSIDLGSTETKTGLGFAASRWVSVNPELGPGQHRYVLRDRLSISIPVGLFTTHVITPVGLYYTYTFEYLHSVATLREVGTSRFFSLLNPFSLREIRRNLRLGEQLILTHSVGASVGKVKVHWNEEAQLEAALMGRSRTRIKSVYFAKPTEDLLEVATDHIRIKRREAGFDIRFYLRLAAMLRRERSKHIYRLYRLDSLNESPEGAVQLQKAFDAALIENDFDSLDRLVSPHRLTVKGKSQSSSFGLFLWNVSADTGLDLLKADGRDIVAAYKNHAYGRAFDRIWNEKVFLGPGEIPANYFGAFWNEGTFLNLSFEGLPDKDHKSFLGAQVNITVSMLDNYCTRKEFDNDFKAFFQERSGARTEYIPFKMPPELEAYPELLGTMHWQISFRALRSILAAASDPANLGYLDSSGDEEGEEKHQGKAYEASVMAGRILQAFNGRGRAGYTTDEQARDLISLLDRLAGRRGRFLGHLRRFVRDEDIWLITDIANMLDLTNPTFAQGYRGRYWAPEVGQYQGPTPVERFRRNALWEPSLVP